MQVIFPFQSTIHFAILNLFNISYKLSLINRYFSDFAKSIDVLGSCRDLNPGPQNGYSGLWQPYLPTLIYFFRQHHKWDLRRWMRPNVRRGILLGHACRSLPAFGFPSSVKPSSKVISSMVKSPNKTPLINAQRASSD